MYTYINCRVARVKSLVISMRTCCACAWLRVSVENQNEKHSRAIGKHGTSVQYVININSHCDVIRGKKNVSI